MNTNLEHPYDREEMFLGGIAGILSGIPDTRYCRKELYLAAIYEKISGMDIDIEEIKEKIEKLSSAMKYKGSVADYEHLPTDAELGDVYTTRDNGKEYVWDNEEWLEIGGGVKSPIKLTGTEGVLTEQQIQEVLDGDSGVVLIVDGRVFYLFDKQTSLTYRTFINIDVADSSTLTAKAVYIQLNELAVNYGHWSMEDIPMGSSVNVVQTTGQSTTDVMSQKAVTDSLGGKQDALDFYHETNEDAENVSRIVVGEEGSEEISPNYASIDAGVAKDDDGEILDTYASLTSILHDQSSESYVMAAVSVETVLDNESGEVLSTVSLDGTQVLKNGEEIATESYVDTAVGNIETLMTTLISGGGAQ